MSARTAKTVGTVAATAALGLTLGAVLGIVAWETTRIEREAGLGPWRRWL